MNLSGGPLCREAFPSSSQYPSSSLACRATAASVWCCFFYGVSPRCWVMASCGLWVMCALWNPVHTFRGLFLCSRVTDYGIALLCIAFDMIMSWLCRLCPHGLRILLVVSPMLIWVCGIGAYPVGLQMLGS